MAYHQRLDPRAGISLLPWLTAIVAFGLLSGCSSLGLKAPWDRSDQPDYDLIADNLINAISQMPNLNPVRTALQVTDAQTSFESAVQQELTQSGYTVVPFGSSDTALVIRSQMLDAEPANVVAALNQVAAAGGDTQLENYATGPASVYTVSFGKISAERAYSVVDGRTLPVSELTIRGAAEQPVALNDVIFNLPDSALSSVAFGDYAGPEIEDVLKPEPARRTVDEWGSPIQGPVKENVYLTLESNYRDVFSDYEEVEREVLIFPNDSLRMGDGNKQIIESFVDKMDPDTDLLSVIGCSHGNTEINNGNSLLALGRANRVKEAFLFSGISHDKVLEEGCWAPQTFEEVMPNRGVVLTLKRRKDAS